MALKKCNFCENQVPEGGQCNKCGYLDGISRAPTDEEFKKARAVNKQHNYAQYINLDMVLLEAEQAT